MKPLTDVIEIRPLTRPPNCTITVPGSKSITIRALILAALSKGQCTLRGALWVDDMQVMVDSLQKLGFEVTVETDPVEECNRTITVVGCDGEIPSKKAELYVGNSGTAARFLTALVALGYGEYRITGDQRISEQPIGDLLDALRQLHVEVHAEGNSLPASVHAKGLKGGTVTVSARRSSQFASALLLIVDKAQFKLQLAEPDEPFSCVDMTCRMVDTFRHDYLIEPDLSGASCFASAGFLTGGRVEIGGWPRHSLQADGRFPQFLPPPLKVSRMRDLGDSVMTLVICAVGGGFPLLLTEASRMRGQKCDRIHAMATELHRVGAQVVETEEGLLVEAMDPSCLHEADIETYNDHHMATCFAVLGLKVPGIRIKNPGCVSTMFPNFFEKLERLHQ